MTETLYRFVTRWGVAEVSVYCILQAYTDATGENFRAIFSTTSLRTPDKSFVWSVVSFYLLMTFRASYVKNNVNLVFFYGTQANRWLSTTPTLVICFVNRSKSPVVWLDGIGFPGFITRAGLQFPRKKQDATVMGTVTLRSILTRQYLSTIVLFILAGTVKCNGKSDTNTFFLEFCTSVTKIQIRH
jgi:hypothetical protein